LGYTLFDNFAIYQVSQSEFEANHPLKLYTPPPLLRQRVSGAKFPSAPAYTVQRDANGAWWLVRPDGTPYWQRSVEDIDTDNVTNPYLFQNIPAYYKAASATN